MIAPTMRCRSAPWARYRCDVGAPHGRDRGHGPLQQHSYNSFLFVILAGWHAKVAELVDALALGASGVTRESSSLSFRTMSINTNPLFLLEFREFQHAG